MPRDVSKLGVLALLAAAALLSTFSVLIRTLDQAFGPLTQVGLRSGVSALLFAGIMVVRRLPWRPRSAPWGLALLLMLAFPLMTIFWTLSVVTIKASNALFLLYGTNFLFALAIGVTQFRERLTRVKLTAAILFLLGVYCFAQPSAQWIWSVGVAYGLASGFFEALTNAARKALPLSEVWTLLLYQALAGAVLGLGLAWGTQEPMWQTVAPQHVLVLAIFGVEIVLSCWLMHYGFNHVPLKLGTMLVAIELIFTVGLNAWWLHEIPSSREWLGAAIMLTAIVVAYGRADTNSPS